MQKQLPLVVLPGNMCDERAYEPLYPAFSGREIFFADLTRDASIADMAARTLRSAPENFVILGHSMGGITALEVMRQAPERVAGAILIATNPTGETDERKANRMNLVAQLDTKPLSVVVAELLAPHYFLVATSHRTDLVIDMASALGTATFRSQAQALMNRADSWESLSQMTMPVLLMGGREDRLVSPQRVFDMAKAMPDAACAVIDNSGHFPSLERPSEVNAIIEAWSSEHDL